jgi:glutamyl-tRNA synthetase
VRRIVDAAGDRIKIAGDVLDFDEFFVDDDELTWDEKAMDKRIRRAEGAEERLARLRDRLAAAKSWDAAALEEEVRAFIDAEGVKIGKVIHALRVAVTGKGVGLGMFDTLAILGRDRSLRRIERALEAARAGSRAS